MLRHQLMEHISTEPVPFELQAENHPNGLAFREVSGSRAFAFEMMGHMFLFLLVMSVPGVIIATIAGQLLDALFVIVYLSVVLLLVLFFHWMARITRQTRRTLVLNWSRSTVSIERVCRSAAGPTQVHCSFTDAMFGRHRVALRQSERSALWWRGHALAVTIAGETFPLAVKPTQAEIDEYLMRSPPFIKQLPWVDGEQLTKFATLRAGQVVRLRP